MARDRGLRQSVPGVSMPKADVSGRPPFSQAEPLKPPPSDTAWLTGELDTCPKCAPERGVWVVYYHDMGPHVESVHGSEIEALRVINDATGKRVAFVPFGSEVREVLK